MMHLPKNETSKRVRFAKNLFTANEKDESGTIAKKSEKNALQNDSVSMTQLPAEEVIESNTIGESMTNKKLAAILLNDVNPPYLNMSGLLDTPYKDYGFTFPQIPNLSNILSQLTTP